ncbi:hypothetical protein HUT06_00625 [Actinomadura sp. NAK00032]|uniref:hypothetical protein n=1 Tax=Actinomadura sp. NAK00032 TaxID=2742128 RepID=UPI00159187EA|nr:hypothetical protein [Actinomadura sp. NAK00032]QKW32719.1 hypothetical protein HUT06_00625 [Actinomadura sp. NAK00032]
MEPVGWEGVRKFRITSVERPVTTKRKRAVSGVRAVRTPQGGKNFLVYAPCAHFAPEGSEVPLPSSRNLTLFEDEAAQKLLCYVEPAKEVDGQLHHVVRDGDHAVIGVVRRVPPRRPFRHTWRIDRPDLPEMVGRNAWASSGPGVASRVAVTTMRVGMSVIDSLGSEGEGRGTTSRALEWWSGDDMVMESTGSEEVTIHNHLVDRRLAFAFALVGDR